MEDIKQETKGRKGFYVRMRFLHSNHRHGRAKDNNNNNNNIIISNKKTNYSFNFYFRFIKWIIWLCLSFYFFTSLSSLSKNHTNLSPHSQPSSILPSSNSSDLKIYVYELPEKYNKEWVSNERCSKHLFASEVAIHKAIIGSRYETHDPYEADFFLVPIYVACNFSKVNGFPAIGHARTLIQSGVDIISRHFPFWNRSHGSDHLFVASHDFGACFHTLEDVAKEDGIAQVVKGSIILQTFGVQGTHPCQEAEHVVIPPYIPPDTIRSTLSKFPLHATRDIFAFFRGKMELHPKNVSGRFYSRAVRTKIWRHYNNDPRFYLRRTRYPGYQSEIARSVFCLCPLGWAPWSPRLVESVALGCVPVIIADGIRLPFDNVIPWPEISITVAENDVDQLGSILDHIAKTNLTTLQENLWDPAVRGALLFNDHIEEGDATWQVLEALSHKVHRSYRRSEVASE